MDSQNQIKIIAFRNALYQGYLNGVIFHKLGAVLTQDFLFCLANWNNGALNGPCFTLFPNQKIFYGHFANNQPQGLCCYEMGLECQIYCYFEDGQMQRHMVAVFPIIECILDLNINQSQEIACTRQIQYQNTEQKWKIVQQLLNMKIPSQYKKFNKFIKHELVANFKQIEEVYGQDYYIGFKGEGLGIKIGLEDLLIKSVGLFNENNILQSLGKKIISREKQVKQEGIYSNPETLIRYQQQPQKKRKAYRDFFRLSINFQNKFFQLPILDRIQYEFSKLKIKIRDSTTQRIAQQLIQHLDPEQFQEYPTGNVNQTVSQSRYRAQLQVNRSKLNATVTMNDKDYYHGGKMMPQVSLDNIKQELERSLSHKKSQGNRSPYKQYNLSPAQLKYTSKLYNKFKKQHIPDKYNTDSKVYEKYGNNKEFRGHMHQTNHERSSTKYNTRNRQNPDRALVRYNTDIDLEVRDRPREYQLRDDQANLKPSNSSNPHNFERYRQTKAYPYKQITRELDFDQPPRITSHYDENEKERYPLQSKFRAIHVPSYNISPNKYKYLDQNNPQRHKNQLLPERTYVNKTAKKEDTKEKYQDRSALSFKNKTNDNKNKSAIHNFTSNPRLEKISCMYDQIHQKERQRELREKQMEMERNKFALNRGKGYKFSDDSSQIDAKIGLVSGGRKIPSPVRKSKSKNKVNSPQKDYSMNYYNTSHSTQYKNKYKEPYNTDRNDLSTEYKSNYGYFSKNR